MLGGRDCLCGRAELIGAPAEAVTPAKQRLVSRTALRYAQANGLMDEYMRFDVASVCGRQIDVIKNAFDFVE